MRHFLLCLSLALSPLAAQAGDIDSAAALNALAQPGAVLIDVRSQEEFASGYDQFKLARDNQSEGPTCTNC